MGDLISRQAAIDCEYQVKIINDIEYVMLSEVQMKMRKLPSADRPQEWIPCSERMPSEEERKEWIDNNLDGIGYLYPCLVTRYSSINPDRTKNNPYVAKHYFDGEDFVNCGEEVCSEYILAWMPLPKPWKGADDE